jgi:hypothetical protein
MLRPAQMLGDDSAIVEPVVRGARHRQPQAQPKSMLLCLHLSYRRFTLTKEGRPGRLF